VNRNSLSIERRRFLSAVTSTATGLLAGGTGLAQTDMSALLAVAYGHAGRRIPSDFIGLSYESAVLADGNYFASDNASVLGLIRALGDHQPDLSGAHNLAFAGRF